MSDNYSDSSEGRYPESYKLKIEEYQCWQSDDYSEGSYPASNAVSDDKSFTHTNKGIGMEFGVDFEYS